MVNINEQCLMFLSCALAGAVAGVLFDFFRAVKVSFSLKKSMPVLDILFWILVTGITVSLIYASGKGQMRGFVFLGIFLGFFLYLVTVSRFVFRGFRWLNGMLRKSAAWIYHFISAPFLFIGGKAAGFFQFLMKFMKNAQKKGSGFVKKRLAKFHKNSII